MIGDKDMKIDRSELEKYYENLSPDFKAIIDRLGSKSNRDPIQVLDALVKTITNVQCIKDLLEMIMPHVAPNRVHALIAMRLFINDNLHAEEVEFLEESVQIIGNAIHKHDLKLAN